MHFEYRIPLMTVSILFQKMNIMKCVWLLNEAASVAEELNARMISQRESGMTWKEIIMAYDN
jgi:hypothetical protein